MLTLEQAREALRLDNTDNDDIITGLLCGYSGLYRALHGHSSGGTENRTVSRYGGKVHSYALV